MVSRDNGEEADPARPIQCSTSDIIISSTSNQTFALVPDSARSTDDSVSDI